MSASGLACSAVSANRTYIYRPHHIPSLSLLLIKKLTEPATTTAQPLRWGAQQCVAMSLPRAVVLEIDATLIGSLPPVNSTGSLQ